jgi:hypothetical protein
MPQRYQRSPGSSQVTLFTIAQLVKDAKIYDFK